MRCLIAVCCFVVGVGFDFDFVTVYFVFWCYNVVLSALVICFAFRVGCVA